MLATSTLVQMFHHGYTRQGGTQPAPKITKDRADQFWLLSSTVSWLVQATSTLTTQFTCYRRQHSAQYWVRICANLVVSQVSKSKRAVPILMRHLPKQHSLNKAESRQETCILLRLLLPNFNGLIGQHRMQAMRQQIHF